MTPLKKEQLRFFRKDSIIHIVDFIGAGYPPHRIERDYRVIDNDNESLYVWARGYSLFEYSDYGKTWLAYKI